MQDFGPVATARKQSGDDAANGREFAELRDLLLGPERRQLLELQEQIKNRTLRPGEVAAVLPEAVIARAGRDARLRHALQPLLEEAIVASVRKDPRVMAEALFPIIGAAVRRALATALQTMVDSLNLMVESGFTLRSVQWRIEAARTGKSYVEIALLRSLLYRVEQVFLIQRSTGLLLQHAIAEAAVIRDADMVSGMLTAIQDFVQDSFGSGEDGLETVRVGELTVWIQHGPKALVAAVVRGTPPPQIRKVFASAVENVHREFGDQLASFKGNAEPFVAARPILNTCLMGRSSRRGKPSRAPLYLIVAAVLLAFAGWLTISWREQQKWNRYLSALRDEPGITVTDQARSGSRFSISGLRDPLASDPAALLGPTGIRAGQVSSHWEPYISLSPPLAARREQLELRNSIEQEVIRFEIAKSTLGPIQEDALENIAGQIKRLLQLAGRDAAIRVEVVGHTDERGSETVNARLGLDRANIVLATLVAFGVNEGILSVRSAGASQPLRTGQTERDQSFNRSVQFRVVSRAN
jgi:outer membrane protein OmpA-like peptidoglycan-associated protein